MRVFDLPEEDEEYLNARGLSWETVVEGRIQWLLVHGFPLPRGYNCDQATAAIQIPQNYPRAGLDMVFFYPRLSRPDGVSINRTEGTATICNLVFQRWSRHRTQENPWREGLDNVSTHLALVEEWLLREFRTRPMGGST